MPRDGDPELELTPGDDRATGAAADRRTGVLEALLHEAIRRTASIGFSSFFATEDAVRRAFADAVPRDWVDYASRQSQDLRAEMIERMSAEFGAWLRSIDMAQVVGNVLADNDFELRISLSSTRKSADRAPELSLVTRRK